MSDTPTKQTTNDPALKAWNLRRRAVWLEDEARREDTGGVRGSALASGRRVEARQLREEADKLDGGEK